MGRLLVIDYGLVRSGLAVTDTMQITANPLETIQTKDLLSWLRDYFAKEEVEKVIIGCPTRMNGQPSEITPQIDNFKKTFNSLFPAIPLISYDERFTSILAQKAMISAGCKKKNRQEKSRVDKIAACIILEDYLESLQLTPDS